MTGFRVGRGSWAALAIALVALAGPMLAHRLDPGAPVAGPAGTTTSDASDCRGQYLAGVMPAYVHPRLERRTTRICYRAFSIGYSALTRTPLWSAEKLTAAAVADAHDMARVNDFHSDLHVVQSDQATLADYRGSGYDRGHMAPSGDMPTAQAQAESFTLANMVPQTPELNRHLWADVEQAVRALARTDAVIYVVTGPVFEGAELDSLGGRVAVPTSTYKAVYIPGQGAAAYIATNTAAPVLTVVSIAALMQKSGIDPFPSLDRQAEREAIALPEPGARRHRRHNQQRSTT